MIIDGNEVLAERLWVGSFVRLEEVKLLRQIGITAVVSVQSDEDLITYHIPVKKLLRAYDQAEIEFRRIATPDFDKNALGANLGQIVAEIEAALAPRWAKVYLHCTAGINRGPTAAAAYLIRARGFSAQEAYEFVLARRHCGPYLDILKEYEESLKIAQ